MGFKSLSLQFIPWCFHLIGAPWKEEEDEQHRRHRRRRRQRKYRPIRLIGSDCRVRIYEKPVSVSELMHEHPLHLVCRSDSFFIGQRVPTLSPAEVLQPGQSYLLLPATFFHSDLSFINLTTSLACPVTPLTPFDIMKTDSGSIQVRVSDEFLERLVKKEEEEEEDEKKMKKREVMRVCNTVQLEKDYKQLVRCKSKQWKPKLETIKESSSTGAKVFREFGRIKRRKKSKNKSKSKATN